MHGRRRPHRNTPGFRRAWPFTDPETRRYVHLIETRFIQELGEQHVGIPRGMQTSADLIRLFPNKLDRIGLLVDFYGSFRKGKYLQSFLKELGPTLVRGLMR
jgi:hypothetical protein